MVAFYQGLRRTELAQLRWRWVDLERCIMTVVNDPRAGEFTKSRKNRTIPLNPVVRDELAALRDSIPTGVESGRAVPKYPHVFTWDDGALFKPDWISHQFARVARTAGVRATLHDCRRSFSTLAQRAGVDRGVVKDLGGWSTVGVVEKHYTGEIQPALERAMERIAKAQGVA